MSEIHEETLIELVRERPSLYDFNHPKYSDIPLKRRMWNEIAKKLDVEDGALCKARWTGIRDNLKKYLNYQSKVVNGQPIKRRKPYRYGKKLTFLNPFMGQPRVARKMKNKDSQSAEDYDPYGSDDHTVTPEAASNLEVIIETPTSSALSDSPQAKPAANSKSEASTLMKYLIAQSLEEKHSSGCSTANSDHPVDSFLRGLSPTLKTLSPYLLNLTKSEIFATVQKYELQMINSQGHYPTATETSHSLALLPPEHRHDAMLSSQ